MKSLLLRAIVSLALLKAVLVLPARAAEPDYVLAPEDSISVIVLRHSELNVSALIPPDGKIVMPIAGEIVAAGKTRSQLAKDIADGLRGRVADPEVSVMLDTPRIIRVYVLWAGLAPAVRPDLAPQKTAPMPPGVFDLKPGWRVTELLAAAGGLSAAPEHAAARLARQDGRVLEIDLVKVLATPNAPENVKVEPGDLLAVLPSAAAGAYVIGRVGKPGFFRLGPGAGVAEAIRSAGGAQAGIELTHVQVYHADGTHEIVDVQKAYSEQDPSLDKPLRGGDAIFVP